VKRPYGFVVTAECYVISFLHGPRNVAIEAGRVGREVDHAPLTRSIALKVLRTEGMDGRFSAPRLIRTVLVR
jgi:hypothetical protein